MFGTFQPEKERPIYGLTTKIGDRMDPIFLNFHEFNDMVKDVKTAKGLRKKLFYIFGSPTAVYEAKIKDMDQERREETSKKIMKDISS